MVQTKTFGKFGAGENVRGEVSSANASAGVAFTLYDENGNSPVLGANQYVVIQSFQVVAAASGVQCIANGTDVAGNRLRRGTFAANSGMAGNGLDLPCSKGVIPVLFAPAGQVDAQLEGRIAEFVA